MEKEKEQKDYMGMICWHKTQLSKPIALYGTDVKTKNSITIELHSAYTYRELHEDGYYADRLLARVELSPTQWIDFLTSGGTMGVPCTIIYADNKYCSSPKERNIIEEFSKEFEEDNFKYVKETINLIKESLKNGKTLNKGQLNNILTKLQNTISNANFTMNQFNNMMKDVTVRAKNEINSYVEEKIKQVGFTDIKNNVCIPSIEISKEIRDSV